MVPTEPRCARRCPTCIRRWQPGRSLRVMPTRSPAPPTASTSTVVTSWRRWDRSSSSSPPARRWRRFDRKVRDLARRLSRDDGLRHHERLKAQRSVSRWTDREGMCHTRISLDPEADARFSAVFDAAVAAEQAKPDAGRTFDQLKADAFITLVTAPAAPGARRPAEINVLIDLATLQHRLHEHQRLRDVRRPATPTSDRATAGLRGRDHPDRAGRRQQGRRRRTSQTPRHRRPTKSPPRHAHDLRRARLPGPLRRLRHPPPQRMETRRRRPTWRT